MRLPFGLCRRTAPAEARHFSLSSHVVVTTEFPMEIYQRLKQDHDRVKELLNTLKTAGAERERLFAELKQDLEIHALFEEEVFYPAIAEKADAGDQIDQAIEEHDQVTSMLEDLQEMEKSDDEFPERIEELAEALAAHIEMEEDELFRLGREALDQREAEDLGRKYDQARETIRKSA
jgi:iron-sulfur cluster repair protein YtfE (RIC family)